MRGRRKAQRSAASDGPPSGSRHRRHRWHVAARPAGTQPHVCRGLWVWIALAAIVAACSGEQAQPPAITGTLPVDAPAAAQVGEEVLVSVGPVDVPDGTQVHLTAVGSYGPHVYRTTFYDGIAHFMLPAEDTRASGIVTLIASAGQARGQTGLTLLPGPPVEPVTPLVGARSIVADGEHWSMAVVVPFDAYGNPVAEGTPVRLRALHPGGVQEEREATIRHLLAWIRVYSTRRAGRTSITAQTRMAHGPEAILLEIAGWPVPFHLSSEAEAVPADGQQLVIVRTDTIRDRYGNVVPDGTLITLVAETPEGKRRVIPAYTLHGVAEVPLQAPRQPGILKIWGTVYGVESEPLELVFTPGPAIGVFPLHVSVDAEEKSVRLDAGPMLGALEQYVPDGTRVLFHLIQADGQSLWLTSVADDGHAYAELRVAELSPGTYTAEAFAGSGKGSAAFSIP